MTTSSFPPWKALPPELLHRILLSVAVTSPKDLLNCRLLCKLWSRSAFSARDLLFVKYNFQIADDMIRGGKQLRIAFLISEFGFLREMERRRLDCSDVPQPAFEHAPKDEAQWLKLTADLDFLVKEPPFHLHVPGLPNGPDEVGVTWIWHILSRYHDPDISWDDRGSESSFDSDYQDKHELFVDEERERRGKELYQALKREDFAELITIQMGRGETGDNFADYEEHGGWMGEFCWFALCRRREPGRNVLGWLMFVT
ncbi:uncharacterized protein EV422DRAFT_623294 [Fimicolochytrium jonesii]|uniref:uncharacterized protein n=1 Tax=Fimicolochytrium jonesii TaxID=1396493 RepID=UPI0022FDDB77|nr:uncharacterized protein EV422DRAFT_623294 [Fimicolochytrium jonesii]KAI8816619.1 hypothetical protein EV422DRAFT_623294 [Fimicolochytrium jonesii]